MKKSWLWILLLVVLAFALYWVNGTLNKVKDVAGWAVDVVWDVADGAADLAWDAVDGAWDLVEWAADVVEGAADAVADGAEAVVDGAADVVEGAADAVADGAEAVVDGAANVVEGAADAVADGAEAVADAAANVAEAEVEADTEVEAEVEEAEVEEAEAEVEVEEEVEAEEVAVAPAAIYSSFQDLDNAKVQAALADGKNVALFFHADRCPTCVALEDNINNDIADIDPNLVIFKADYDNTALSGEYGVTKQHTLVTLDSNGWVVDRKLWINTVSQLNRMF